MLKKSRMPLLIVSPILLGWTGGILRYLHITRGFDDEGLSTNSIWGLLLAVLTLLMTGVALLLAFSGRNKPPKEQPRIGTMGLYNLICFLLALLFGVFSGIFIVWYALKSFNPFDLFTGGMVVCAALLCFFTARKVASRGTGRNLPSALTLVPPVALCVVLIANYRELSVKASTSSYIYILLALISILLTAFSCSAWTYCRISVSRLYSVVFFALYMLPAVILGDGIYLLRVYSKVGLFTAYSLSEAVAPLFLYLYGFFMALGVALLYLRPVRKTLKESFESKQ